MNDNLNLDILHLHMNNGNQEQKTIITKTELFKRITSILIFTTFVVSFLYWGFNNEQKLVEFNKTDDESLFIQITTRIEQLPDCALKSNLRAAALAEYEDESEELNDAIQKYYKEQFKN